MQWKSWCHTENKRIRAGISSLRDVSLRLLLDASWRDGGAANEFNFLLFKSKYLKTTQFHQIIKLGDLCEKQTLRWKEVNSKCLLKQQIWFFFYFFFNKCSCFLCFQNGFPCVSLYGQIWCPPKLHCNKYILQVIRKRKKKASGSWNLGLPQTQKICNLKCEETKQKFFQLNSKLLALAMGPRQR